MQKIHNHDYCKTYNFVICESFKDIVTPNLSNFNNMIEINHTTMIFFYITKSK